MREGFDRIKELKEQAGARARVADAATYAIQEADLLHKLGKTGADSAIQAVKHDLAEYVGTGPDNIADLRNIAQDAAEGIFRQLGFDSAELMEDFNSTLSEQLGISARTE